MSAMSYSDSTSRLPVSSDSARANSLASRSMMSATRNSSSARSRSVVCGHGPVSNAVRAAAMAARVSSAVASATVATSVPSAGQRISRVPPSAASRHAPPM